MRIKFLIIHPNKDNISAIKNDYTLCIAICLYKILHYWFNEKLR